MYINFSPRGANPVAESSFPFKVIIETAQSGISYNDFKGKAPCDTGDATYMSAFQYKEMKDYPRVNTSGELSFKVYSGSLLFVSPNLYDETQPVSGVQTSYQGDKNQYVVKNDCTGIYKEPVMTIYGLNRNVFLKDFYSSSNDTLKIWLGVAFPVGDPNPAFDIPSSLFRTYATGDCSDCLKRANTPMTAFIGCNTGEWLKSVESKLINKSVGTGVPRYERRQLLARVPIAEIKSDGNGTYTVSQRCNSNLTLIDMCMQGIPAKFPLSVFNEYK